MNDGFIRQRRNLYTISGVLLFCFMAQVQISQLSIVGISFSGFKKPEITYMFLWGMWGYFFYRFMVYFIEHELKTFLGIWRREVERYSNVYLRELASSNASGRFLKNQSDYYSMKRNNWVLNYQEEHLDEQYGTPFVKNKTVQVLRRSIFKYQVVGVLRLILLTTVVTDYFFPLITGLLVFTYAGFGMWEGSLLHIFN
ncbi:hypothetical protein VCSRO70_3455 [Vibrio cholerae]|uniref:Uncharacterized protein n=1 Tax=Vibrio cholerae TaxID=666 RepID=A0A5B0Y5Z5_VIBCL|nr:MULTISPECIES: hypothetical protein [Vibrio]AIL70788.1 hypothetical protein VV93_v1c17000 [Vibrio vulnificus]EIF5160979.1 hypothetical protein [Vibrio cholerae]EKF9401135.1 hypothetical protein [Vibrio cholerae]KAA1206574.1 hypothetical protein F0M02_17720 [Vibrio cholerae]KAA1252498.1 hypothetical protein F0M16_22575 [Vibrio cholerae]